MIIGWSAPAQVRHWKHAQLIKCSAETFYNKQNNNLLTDGNHFPSLKTEINMALRQQNEGGGNTLFSRALKIFLAEPHT